MRRFIIIITFLISFAVIFYKFNEIPKNLFHDESDFKSLALSLNNKPYTPYSTLATGHSTLYFYIILFSFKTFGTNNFALRLPSALFGAVNIILFYLVMKQVFSNSKSRQIKDYIPILLTLIFGTLRWNFNFARFSFEATFLLSLELTAIYFLFRYFRSSKTYDILSCSFFTGLVYNSYTPGRIFFVLIFVFLFFKSYLAEQVAPLRQGSEGRSTAGLTIRSFSEGGRETRDRIWKQTFKQLMFSLIIFLLTIAPLSIYLATHKDNRFDKQFFLKNTELSINSKIAFLGENISKTALMFNFNGDINARHNYPKKPALNPILGLLFIAGLILAIKNIKKFPNNFFLAYFVIALLPAILTYPWENPNMLRTYTVIPSLIFFVGKSLEFMGRNLAKRNFPIIFSIIIVLILLSSIYEVRTYFLYHANILNTSF